MSTYSPFIRDIPDFPKPGIIFKDITPLLLNPSLFAQACQDMALPYKNCGIQIVAAAEARGFLFGPAIARELNAGFLPVRKPGKLPGTVIKQSYDLEYGTDSLEIHAGQITPGAQVLVVDDVLATGGTMAATLKLIEQAQGIVSGFSFFIELSFLNGRQKLNSKRVHSVLSTP